VRKLSTLYADVNDVDLFVGGFLERKDDDGILGPTFRCLLGDTFARLVMIEVQQMKLSLSSKAKQGV